MEADPTLTGCPECGGVWLNAEYDYKALPANWPELVRQRPTTMWRYWELLPFPEGYQPLASLGEGWTPLSRSEGLERESNRNQIWIKDERQQPTNSFKDRQAAATVSILRTQGVDELALASTGNAAAAYAAFCARAGIKLWVFLTSSVPTEKMRELALYGAEVIKVTGTYDQAKEVAADFAERRHIHFDKGAKAIPGKESMKSLAFEIAEQLDWQAPDWYVQAVSGGIGPLGVLKGFEELYRVGLIDRVPKIGVVQSAGCAPMVYSWERGLDRVEPVIQPDTLITVLATGQPGLAYQILKKAGDKYGGAMISVDDGEAFRAMRRVARVEGLSVEPATSVAFAGLTKLIEEEHIKAGERVVVNCSGHTFSAEKHALEDRYVLHLDTPLTARPSTEGLATALKQLDEQVTTIVVIDDNPHDSRLIRRLLQNYKNYRVFEAHNGPDGLDLIRQRRPDLVVLDLTMPNMDGFSILEAIKLDERTKETRVMIVSAKTLTAGEEEYLQRHTDSIWQKGSFSARALVEHVVGVLGDEDGQAIPGRPAYNARQIEEKPVESFGQMGHVPILVVDSYESDARLMRRLLESRSHFEVIEAYSGAEALAAIRQRAPRLVILELNLPDMSGEKLLDRLRHQPATQKVPIVVVSSKDINAELRAKIATQTDSIWAKGTLDRSSFLTYVETMLSE